MSGIRWRVDPGALLCLALAYFFDSGGVFSAFIPAAAVHELGHALALRLCGSRVRQMSLSAFGLKMDYTGNLSGWKELLSIAAGPRFGLAFAFAAVRMEGEFWTMSGVLSLLLSAFNLMPVLPLDGGRLVAVLTDSVFARRLSRFAAAALVLCGCAMLAVYHSLSLLAIGLWLAVYNFK